MLVRKMLRIFVIIVVLLGLVSCKGTSMKEEKRADVNKINKSISKEDININDNTIINIMDIANKSTKEVNKVLGEPIELSDEEFEFTETGEHAKESSRALYQKENLQIDIFFIEGIAGQIVITYNDKTVDDINEEFILSSIGLKVKPYTVKNNEVIQWTNVYSLYDIWITEAAYGENVSVVIITDKKFG